MQTLSEVKIGSLVKIVTISDELLSKRLHACGIFSGSLLVKTGDIESDYKTLKIQAKNGSVTLPGRIAEAVNVTVPETGLEIPLYRIDEGASCIIKAKTEIDKPLHQWTEQLGLTEGEKITVMRRLPHMEYRLLIEDRKRTRITESHASAVIGFSGITKIQMSFAGKGKPFKVDMVLPAENTDTYLSSAGISKGTTIILEGIEPGKDVVLDSDWKYCLYSPNGFRLLISETSASEIEVKIQSPEQF